MAPLRIDQLPKVVRDRLRAGEVSRARDTPTAKRQARASEGPGRLRCASCGTEVAATQTTSASQERHMAETGHRRYELIIAGDTTEPG